MTSLTVLLSLFLFACEQDDEHSLHEEEDTSQLVEKEQVSPGYSAYRTGAVGDPHYCTDLETCNNGEGDCDSSSECSEGLVCRPNVGAEYGWAASVDVCETPQNGDGIYCSAASPCDDGEGDCDSNSECSEGLICRPNTGAEYGWAASIDVCEAPENGDNTYCSESSPCNDGEGDCDSNSECNIGLACRSNVGAGYGWPASVDVCELQVLGEMGYCTPENPCSLGQGDCDSASDCQLGLACIHNVGGAFGFLPHVDLCL